MKTLEKEQMAEINGGINIAAFACGFGIVAIAAQPELAVAFGEGTALACASLFN
jgi:hypothetical protein